MDIVFHGMTAFFNKFMHFMLSKGDFIVLKTYFNALRHFMLIYNFITAFLYVIGNK